MVTSRLQSDAPESDNLPALIKLADTGPKKLSSTKCNGNKNSSTFSPKTFAIHYSNNNDLKKKQVKLKPNNNKSRTNHRYKKQSQRYCCPPETATRLAEKTTSWN
jgi:hypothetical protein